MTWYAFGDFVLDRILGVDQCREVQIFAPRDASVRPADVREALRVRDDATISITDAEPRLVIEADRYVIDERGHLRDRVTDAATNNPGPTLELMDFDLTAADVIRIYRLMNRYSELVTDPRLTSRIMADITHMKSLFTRFPELELLVMDSFSG